MRPLAIIGLILAVLGGFILFRGGGSVKTRDDLVKIGDVKISTTDKHVIPGWAGGIALGIGVVLIFAGVNRKP